MPASSFFGNLLISSEQLSEMYLCSFFARTQIGDRGNGGRRGGCVGGQSDKCTDGTWVEIENHFAFCPVVRPEEQQLKASRATYIWLEEAGVRGRIAWEAEAYELDILGST